ncbi:aminotransferase class I/II-fold pyridoxal phosphate-dependent enzyme, partial [Luoshenia tenuis]|uniref:aminotransferase class I/II-fold pyridoxal phosphate-dependent enzyme n=2 Tax=Clostridia TaxID=186801 RepID=UPI003D935DD1
MEKLWSAVTQRLEPYVPGEQPQDRQYIKLNTNENPYPPSPRALEAIHAAAGDGLRLYPDPEALKLRRAIAQRHGLGIEEVFAGNGSDEVLALAFQAFFDPSRTLLFPDITYSFYPVFCGLFGIPYREVP